MIVALNMSHEPREIKTPPSKILLSTTLERDGESIGSRLHLAPNEAVILTASS